VISRKTIDDVLATAQVEEVISDFMTLKRRGANYEGLCPFHNEKSPSFKVNPVKGIYKCFGCGKAGGALQFIMEHEGMSFVDGIKFLANKYGIEVIEDRSNQSEEYDETVRRKESLLAAINFAQEFFIENLQTEEGKIAGLGYLKERGFTTETIRKFGLGYAPQGFSNFTDKALAVGFKEDVLVDAGLIKSKDSGGYYDFYRERVMFPFHNVAGKIIAFGGRIIKKDVKGPKYVNSPESLLYVKSKILYGIFQAKNAIKKTDTCFLVEGYTDVISLHQAGVENVVASSGTSLTVDQARLIARFSQNVTILYDGDSAGIKASLRGINILLEQGLNVRVVLLDEGEDPDSFARSRSLEEITTYLSENVKDFILFKSKLLYEDAKDDPIKKAEANAEIIKSVAIVPDPLKRAQYIHEFAKISGLPDDVVQAEVIKARNQELGKEIKDLNAEIALIQQQSIDRQKVKTVVNTQAQEKAIAQVLIKFGTLPYNAEVSVAEFIIHSLEQDEMSFQNSVCKTIYDFSRELLEVNETLDFKELMFKSDPDVSSFIADAMDEQYKISTKWAEEEIHVVTQQEAYRVDVFNAVMHLKRVRLKIIMETTQLRLKEDLTIEEKYQILLQLKELLRIREIFGSILKVAVM